jgi:ubiquinone/menaquinone biosynthesis C-methylase UbiE
MNFLSSRIKNLKCYEGRISRMKPANDPNVNYKDLVKEGYNRCATKYADARTGEEHPELAMLIGRLPEGASVLDIGCGGGIPVCLQLAKRANVTGIDISPAMIELAKKNVPSGNFACSDIMSVEFPDSSFDAVTSFYAIFHLPKEEHEELFCRIYRWLIPGGYLLATFARRDESPYTEDDFFGVTMYWSNFGIKQYREMLDRLGFSIIENGLLGHGYKNGVKQQPETHPFIFAGKV